MKALVTGGGFLGRALAEMLLGRGDQVRLFSRRRHPEIEKLGAESAEGDVRDLDALVKACMGRDAAFHTAALRGASLLPVGVQGLAAHAAYEEVNVKGTRNLIEACKRRGVGRLVYAGAASAVFAMQDERGIDESAPCPPRYYDLHAETKARAEQLVLTASGSDGLLACSLRPHLLWGPRDPHFIAGVIRRARRRELCRIGRAGVQAALTYIDNAAAAHLLACDALSAKRVAGQAYFITDEQPVVFWDWVNALLERLGLPPATKRLPACIAYGLGACAERAAVWLKRRNEPRLTRFLARALSCAHVYDLSKARRDFGYRQAVANEEGVRRTAEYLANEPGSLDLA